MLLAEKAQNFLPVSAGWRSRFCQHICEIFHGSWRLFSLSLSVKFFRCKLLKTIKHLTLAELTNYARCKSWVYYKQRNEILKEKSKNKILKSFPVSIFDKSCHWTLQIRLAGTLQHVANEPIKCVHLPSLGCLFDMLNTSYSTYNLALCLRQWPFKVIRFCVKVLSSEKIIINTLKFVFRKSQNVIGTFEKRRFV